MAAPRRQRRSVEQYKIVKLYLFVAIDRTSKFAYAELHGKAKRQTASDFLKALIKAVPYKIHTVLTDNGIQFADLPKNRMGPTALWRGEAHPAYRPRTRDRFFAGLRSNRTR
jgi:hypothetical protein